MALSSSPKEAVSVVQVLTDMVEGLALLSDPKKLKEIVQIAYTLPREEQEKADSARKSISDNQAVLTENRKTLAGIEHGRAELENRKSELSDLQAKLDSQAMALGFRERELDQAITKLERDQDTLVLDRKKVEDDKVINSLKAKELSDKEKALNETSESQRKKAEQLKALAGGF